LNKRIFAAGLHTASFNRTGRLRRNACAAALVLLGVGTFCPAALFGQAAHPQAAAAPVLARHYQDGEKIGYTISGMNQTGEKMHEYEARAEGVVSKDATGVPVENLAWTDLSIDDNQIRLSAASRAFREPLSLAQGAKLGIGDLYHVQAGLVGPVTDLLTFYADVKIAMNQHNLVHPGDHAYVSFGAPSSWADGTRIILGQDSIDFAVMLKSIDAPTDTATLVVRHVPPEQPQLKLPARWMSTPVAAAQNNWVQVEKTADGKYIAGVGQETFDVEIRLSLATGRILSATMDNPVQVSERICTDAALTACGDPERYSIHRQITLRADQASARAPSK
jgi:hypothetical protein